MLDHSKVVSEMRNGAKRGLARLVRLKRRPEASIGHRLCGRVAAVVMLGLASITLLVACAPRPSPTPTPSPSPEIRVEVSSTKIYPGGTTTLVAIVRGQPAGDAYSYFWSATHEGLNALDGKAIYTAPATMTPGTKIGITVDVGDARGYLIGTSSVDITVSAPSPYHYLFVLDASERTAQKLDGQTWLEGAKDTLEGELDKWILDSANAGLRVFGYTEQPREYCRNTELLVAIAPANKGMIKEKLTVIEPRGEAPLHEAILKGLDDLMPGCDGSCSLTVITRGPDTCTGEDLDAIIGGLRDRQVLGRNLKIHQIAVAPSADDVQALVMLRDRMREVIPSTFYYSADDLATLERILDYTALLGVPDPLYQSIGYAGLGEILQEQGDSAGSSQMFDRSLELVPDAINELYQRGLIWGSLGIWEKANQDLTILTIHEPRENEIYCFLRGVTWYNLGRYQLAEADFATASSLNPDFALAEYARGLTLARLEQPGVQDAFRKAFLIKPDLFVSPYFETIPPKYKVPSFYETATPSEFSEAGQVFFHTPMLFQRPEFLVGP